MQPTLAASINIDHLKSRLYSLPQELFDEIFDLTFTIDKNSVTFIDASYKPPSILQVNRATRNLTSRAYYQTTFKSRDSMLLAKWSEPILKQIEETKPRIFILVVDDSTTTDSDHKLKAQAVRMLVAAAKTVFKDQMRVSLWVMHVRVETESGRAVWPKLSWPVKR